MAPLSSSGAHRRSWRRSPLAPRSASREAGEPRPSPRGHPERDRVPLARRRAARRRRPRRAPSCCPALAAALFEAGTLDRAAAVADSALALGERLGLARVRWRAAVERERLHVFRNPEAVDPDASLAVTRRAVSALRAARRRSRARTRLLPRVRAGVAQGQLGDGLPQRRARAALRPARWQRLRDRGGRQLHGVGARHQRGLGFGRDPRVRGGSSARSPGASRR